MQDAPGVYTVKVAGGIRRWQETVDEILLVAAAAEPEPVLNMLAGYRRVREVLVRDQDRIRVQTWWGVLAELRVVAPREYGVALLLATGSQEHCCQLMEWAREKGLTLDRPEPGSSGDDSLWLPGSFNPGNPLDPVPGVPLPEEEEHIYRRLKLWPVPPELREGREEIELAAGDPPRILEVGDIKGDLHVHSDWSDGANSIL